MRAFRFDRPRTLGAAVRALQGDDDVQLKAGGTDLLEQMKERILEPTRVVGLVDVGDAAREIVVERGELVLGALVTLAQLAASPVVESLAPSLGEAARQAASPQIRHRASVAGNLCQRTRCGYFRHATFPCFRRGASLCSTLQEGAVQENAAIFGNEICASAHPSSLAPVLAALDAVVRVAEPAAPDELRVLPLRTLFHEEQVRGRHEDLALPAGAVINEIRVPRQQVDAGHVDAYEEVRARAAFDWALASAAVRLVREDDQVRDASIWLGAVAPIPWRAAAAEAALVGTFSPGRVEAAAEAATQGATPLAGNRHKVALVQAVVGRAIRKAWERS